MVSRGDGDDRHVRRVRGDRGPWVLILFERRLGARGSVHDDLYHDFDVHDHDDVDLNVHLDKHEHDDVDHDVDVDVHVHVDEAGQGVRRQEPSS